MTSKVVVGYDGSDASRDAVHWAAGEALARDGELIILAAMTVPMSASPMSFGVLSPNAIDDMIARVGNHVEDEAEALMTRRFAIINIWRSIAGRVESHPLAFCDSTSLADGDLVEVTRQAKDRVGQIQMARFNPAHKWYYFPAMEAGEAALIKTYDSATDGRNRFTIHTAFDDPTSPPDAAPRQSIETRCFAFF